MTSNAASYGHQLYVISIQNLTWLWKRMPAITYKDVSCRRFMEKDFILSPSIHESLAHLSAIMMATTRNDWLFLLPSGDGNITWKEQRNQ